METTPRIWYTETMPVKNTKKKVIPFRRTLFWDVDPKTIDPEKHARYIIERILEFGNDQEVRWAYQFYPQPLVRRIVERSRSIGPQTRSLWRILTKR